MAEIKIVKPSDEELIRVFRKSAKLIESDRVPQFRTRLPLAIDWTAILSDETEKGN